MTACIGCGSVCSLVARGSDWLKKPSCPHRHLLLVRFIVTVTLDRFMLRLISINIIAQTITNNTSSQLQVTSELIALHHFRPPPIHFLSLLIHPVRTRFHSPEIFSPPRESGLNCAPNRKTGTHREKEREKQHHWITTAKTARQTQQTSRATARTRSLVRRPPDTASVIVIDPLPARVVLAPWRNYFIPPPSKHFSLQANPPSFPAFHQPIMPALRPSSVPSRFCLTRLPRNSSVVPASRAVSSFSIRATPPLPLNSSASSAASSSSSPSSSLTLNHHLSAVSRSKPSFASPRADSWTAAPFTYIQSRNMSTGRKKIKVKNPVVELDGDEVRWIPVQFFSLSREDHRAG